MLNYRVTFRGRVQGVGFRHTAHKLAIQNQIVGWVQNQSNGTVVVVCEGEQAELNRFVVALHQTVNGGLGEVEEVTIDDTSITEKSFSEFEIRP